jgi:methyl-accepting chemotaxis protein
MRNWFFNLRTGVKLGLAFTAALLTAFLVGLVGVASIEDLYNRADRINKITRGALNSVVKFRLTAEGSSKALFGGTGDKDTPWNKEIPDATAKDRALLQRLAKDLRDQANVVIGNKSVILSVVDEETKAQDRAKIGMDASEDDSQQKLAEISTHLTNFEARMLSLETTLGVAGDAGEGTGIVRELKMDDARKAIIDVLQPANGLEGGLDGLAASAIDRMGKARRRVLELMLGAAAAGTLLALLVGVITTRMVVQPLTEMTAAAHRISEGDLSADIGHVSRDEVGGLADSFRRMQASLRDLQAEAQRVASGDLTRSVRGGGQFGDAFNRMVESLSALLREIQEAGTQVRGNSTKILAGLQRNAEASREEAAVVEKVQGSMEQLSEAARAIATSSADVERTAGDAARVASQGTASVGSALEGLFKTRERVNEITQKTMILGEKCRRIGEVLKIIRDVAGEIHMLALNAAIESAASAGEHGKRFTVVAAEVRRLAERTRQSAEEIRAILTEIQEAAEATVAASQEGAKEVEAGSTVATNARAAMEEVIGRIHQTAEAAREISRTTQDQRASSEQVASSMRDISRTVRRMAEGTEDSTKAVRELTALAERFGDLIGTFRTG